MTPIKYIGHRNEYREGCYGSGLVFIKGQTINIEDDELARKLLKHKDIYVLGDSKGAIVAYQEIKVADDESQQDMRDSIANMPKDALKMFAKNTFSAELDMRKSVGDLRAHVTGLFDQFGVE